MGCMALASGKKGSASMSDIAKLLQEAIDRRPAANGLAIIVANASSSQEGTEKLPGVYRDLEAMKTTFEELRYATFPIHDANAHQIREIVRAATAPATVYPRRYKRIAFVFAGHGGENVIQTHTEPIDLRKDVFGPFQPHVAPQIGDFPKLFFIDACRGKLTDAGVEVPIARGANNQSQLVPSKGNCLLAFATLSRMKSFEQDGGLWMQTVATLLREDQDSIGDVLQKVSERVTKTFSDRGYPHIQQPIFHSTLNSSPFSLRKEADKLNREYAEVPNVEQEVYSGPELEVYTPAGTACALDPPERQSGSHRVIQSLSRQQVTDGGVSSTPGQMQSSCSSYPSAFQTPPAAFLQHQQSVPLQPFVTAQWPSQGVQQLIPSPSLDLECSQNVDPLLIPDTGLQSPPLYNGGLDYNPACGAAALYQHQPGTELHATANGFPQGPHPQLQQQVLSPGGPATPPNTHAPPLLNPQYEYVQDHSRGKSRFKCTIKYSINGYPETVNSGGYHATIVSAKEAAERNLTEKSFFASLHSRGTTATKQDYKSKLVQYYVNLNGMPTPNIKYTTKEISKRRGYRSTVAAPGMGYVTGECGKNKAEAERSAAFCMLERIEKYGR